MVRLIIVVVASCVITLLLIGCVTSPKKTEYIDWRGKVAAESMEDRHHRLAKVEF